MVVRKAGMACDISAHSIRGHSSIISVPTIISTGAVARRGTCHWRRRRRRRRIKYKLTQTSFMVMVVLEYLT